MNKMKSRKGWMLQSSFVIVRILFLILFLHTR